MFFTLLRAAMASRAKAVEIFQIPKENHVAAMRFDVVRNS